MEDMISPHISISSRASRSQLKEQNIQPQLVTFSQQVFPSTLLTILWRHQQPPNLKTMSHKQGVMGLYCQRTWYVAWVKYVLRTNTIFTPASKRRRISSSYVGWARYICFEQMGQTQAKWFEHRGVYVNYTLWLRMRFQDKLALQRTRAYLFAIGPHLNRSRGQTLWGWGEGTFLLIVKSLHSHKRALH